MTEWRWVANAYGGNHSAEFRCMKSTSCTPETYTVLYINSIYIQLEGSLHFFFQIQKWKDKHFTLTMKDV